MTLNKVFKTIHSNADLVIHVLLMYCKTPRSNNLESNGDLVLITCPVGKTSDNPTHPYILEICVYRSLATNFTLSNSG